MLKLSEYGNNSSYGTRGTRGTGGLRTIGGGGGNNSNMRSKTRDMYELRDMGDSGELAQGRNDVGSSAAKGYNVAGATFYKEGERSGSEEMILGSQQQNGNMKGIMMTREVIVK